MGDPLPRAALEARAFSTNHLGRHGHFHDLAVGAMLSSIWKQEDWRGTVVGWCSGKDKLGARVLFVADADAPGHAGVAFVGVRADSRGMKLLVPDLPNDARCFWLPVESIVLDD